MFSPPPTDQRGLGTEFVLRAVALVRAKRLPPVLVRQGRYYLATNAHDPWGSKEPIQVRDLRALIEFTENGAARPALQIVGGINAA